MKSKKIITNVNIYEAKKFVNNALDAWSKNKFLGCCYFIKTSVYDRFRGQVTVSVKDNIWENIVLGHLSNS